MNSSDSVKPVRVNYDFSTAKVSKKETKAEGRLEIEIKDKQGMTHIVPFSDVIISVGKEIRKARSEAKLGKAQKLIHQFEVLKTESAPLFKESDLELGIETKGYELADDWINILKTEFQSQLETIKEEKESFEASVKEESELLETRADYVDSLADDFR